MSDTRNDGVSAIQLLRDLDTVVDAHYKWLKDFHRTLVCGLPPDDIDLCDKAHRLSVFGRWFHGGGRDNLAQWPEMRDRIEDAQQQMHRLASALGKACLAGTPLTPNDYDAFMDSAIQLQTELRALQVRITTDVCLVDHLTGAWNRRSMVEKLTDEQERVARNRQPCCLSMMDLDHFKTVNDRHGHAAGDKVLHRVVEQVRDNLRKYDSIFRYGGEEFLLCLPNISADNAVTVVDRLRGEVAGLRIPLTRGEAIGVTASFGVSPVSTERSVEENIDAADKALFRAKVGGRNQVFLWDTTGAVAN